MLNKRLGVVGVCCCNRSAELSPVNRTPETSLLGVVGVFGAPCAEVAAMTGKVDDVCSLRHIGEWRLVSEDSGRDVVGFVSGTVTAGSGIVITGANVT